ncbi:MAG: hypothetical protein ACTHLA_06460 [Asticcacaulis sp.]|uniref:hypothetical protein n=1 Tax=Asticcacaulis sp. TaxID=1872648 RepID=UPI003F7C0C51
MPKAKTYKNDVSASLHELASDLHEVGLIDKSTMRGFDERCLTPVRAFTANDIRRLREREQVSCRRA